MIKEPVKIQCNGVDVDCFQDGSVELIQKGKAVRTHGFNNNGYRCIKIGGKIVYVHRLIARAYLPDFSEEKEVDHINGCRSDNRPMMLRMATRSENQKAYNRPRKGSTSRFRGVCWNKKAQRWIATLQHKNFKKCLGLFTDEEQAARVWDVAAQRAGFPKECCNF